METKPRSRWQRLNHWLRTGHWSGWPLIVAGLSLIGAGFAIDFVRQSADISQRESERLALMADAHAASIEAQLSHINSLLDRLERALIANPNDALVITTTIAGLSPGIRSVLVLDGNGRVLASSRGEQMLAQLGNHPLVWAALADADTEAKLSLHAVPGELGSSGIAISRARRGMGIDNGVLVLHVDENYLSRPGPHDIGIELAVDDTPLVVIAGAQVRAPSSLRRTIEPSTPTLSRPLVLTLRASGASTRAAIARSLSFGAAMWLAVALMTIVVGVVSSLRRAELKRLRSVHQRMLQGNEEGLVGVDLDGRIRFANPAFSTQIGLAPGALLGVDVRQLIQWEDATANDSVDRVLSGVDSRREGLACVRLGEDLLRVVVTAARDGGELSGALLSFSDPLHAPASSHHAPTERLYRTLFDLSPDGVIIVDLDTEKPLAFNRAALQMLDLNASALAAMRIRDLEYSPAETIRQLVRVLASGQVEFATRYRRGIEAIDVQVIAQTIEFAARPALYWIVRDMTQTRRASEELATNEALLRTLIDRLPLPLAVFEGRELSLVNARMLIDVGADAARAKDISDLLDALGTGGATRVLIEQRWSLLDTADSELVDPIEVRRSSETVFDLHLARVGTRTLMMLVDLSERDRSEQRLIEARQLAERVNRARSEFLANMSHEIRTPMTAILGLAHLLERSSLAAAQRDYTHKIDGAARTLLAILDDLLDYAKLETGRLSIEHAPFSLRTMLSELEHVFQEIASDKHLRLTFDIDPSTRDGLSGDSARLRQILLNLIGNAIKFTEQGQVRLRVAPGTAPEALVFAVEDSGIGISREQQARIFEAFYQGEGSTTRRYGGTGLGLPITYALVQLMGGELAVESEPHVGSVFTLTLSMPGAVVPHPDSGSAPAPGVPRLTGMRILLVEDHPINRHVVAEILSDEGARVASAALAKDALTLLENHSFDAVLMDIQMPEMDGHEATRRIRQRFSDQELPVVAMTANSSAEDRASSRSAGMNAHLAKPIDVNVLVATLLALAGRGAPPPVVETTNADQEETPVLDAEKALRRLGGNRTLYAQMARLFGREQMETPARLSDAIMAERTAEAIAQTHTLKGVAATLGAEALAEKARRLERALSKRKPATEIQRLLGELRSDFRDATEALKAAADQLQPADLPQSTVPLAEFDRDEFERTLDRLVLALVDGDMAALDVFRELMDQVPAPLLGAMRTVEDALKRLNFRMALEACRGVEWELRRIA